MTIPVFNWFWQIPVDGKPGLIMVKDMHPGPEHIDVPFVGDAIHHTLAHIEARIPQDMHLFEMRIYVRSDVLGIWREIKVDRLTRAFENKKPEYSQDDLAALWESRETLEEPFGP